MVLAIAGQAWGQPGEVTKLLASDAATADQFGESVSIDGDTAIVGAILKDIAGVGANAGSAYIYQQDFGGPDIWGEVTRLIATDAAAGDHFGTSVSISGDIAIVGSQFDDHSGFGNAGSAYIFYRNDPGNDQWGQVAKLTASDAAASDHFGTSVSLSGDFAIVGASLDSDNGSWVGAAYVFYRNQDGNDQWGQVAKLTASDGATFDYFGVSVSISGATAIVGAMADDDNGGVSGSAYIFVKPPSGWTNMTQTVKLTASDGAMFDLFGVSVAISLDTAIVGAYGDTTGQSGSAYVFVEPADGWDSVPSLLHETAKLTAFDGAPGDQFGISVSISGDGATVGARFNDDDGFRSGSAYVFLKPPSGWQNTNQENAKLTASDAAQRDQFGDSISISGDIAIVGAHFNDDDDNGNNSGSAYIFEGVCPCPWDLDGSGDVGILDLLALLAAWGPNPGHPADFDGNGTVDIFDLLTLIANWGACPCVLGASGPTLDEFLTEAGLSMDDWDLLQDILHNGTEEEIENALCWFERYIDGCPGNCSQIPACGDVDPFNECPGDFTGPLGVPDCTVDAYDQAYLLFCWGMPCGDLNGDCTTDPFDLAILLLNWGACPQAPLCGPGPELSCGQGGQGGGGSGSSSSLTEALAQMGFASVDEYQDWLIAASDSEAFVCACVLQALLEAQP
ncbi:MAG: FG-GAP repeat protein [Planctomycetes bacterium]|nr:FG-GAP repeat protein [Planctomycetota bacterium]